MPACLGLWKVLVLILLLVLLDLNPGLAFPASSSTVGVI